MLVNNFLFSFLNTIIFLLPDSIFPYFFSRFNPSFSIGFSASLLLFFFTLSFIKQRGIIIFVLSFLTLLQIFQLNNCFYFGLPLSFENIIGLYNNFEDVCMMGGAVESTYYYSTGLILLLYVCQIIFIRTHPRIVRKKGYAFLLLIILSYVIFSLRQGSNTSYLRPSNPSLSNSISLFFNVVVHELRGKRKNENFKPYTIQKNNECEANIVFVMGESTNSRFQSLYGYEHNTTPFLNSLKSDHAFAASKGLASSVATHASLPLFFNLVREPGHVSLLVQKTLNLIKLAKENGYKTICITAQGRKEFSSSGVESFDEYYEFTDRICGGDDRLFNKIKELKLSKKNFIVIHPWSMHGPYSLFHGAIKKEIPQFDIADPVQKEYAIALLYWDEWICNLKKMIDDYLPKNSLLIVTSDHGEVLNETNLLGHMVLHPQVADVPIFAFGPSGHPFLKWINSLPYISHYDLGIKIAGLLGYRITNPNDDGIHRFIHGSYFYGKEYKAIRWKTEKNNVIFDDISVH
jgi:heptose-I-phosphate ethanolaminephosphotransferase